MKVSSTLQTSGLSPASTTIATKKAEVTASSTKNSSKPEDFLTLGDVKMIEYVSGTTSLADAELNPNAKAFAASLGTKRENGYIQGDASKNYYYSQLSTSDASIIEHATGTSTIIDAMAKATPDVTGFATTVAMGREDGTLHGDISGTDLRNLRAGNDAQLDYVALTRQSSQKANLLVSNNFLSQAIRFIDSKQTIATYSASA